MASIRSIRKRSQDLVYCRIAAHHLIESFDAEMASHLEMIRAQGIEGEPDGIFSPAIHGNGSGERLAEIRNPVDQD